MHRVTRQIGMIILVLLLEVGCRSPSASAPVVSQARPVGEFSIVTLNIAHLLTQTAPDIVALQEADGPSFWSGNFDHVQYLAQQAKLPHHTRGSHVNKGRIDYGTALLSKHPLSKTQSVKFPPSPPTFNKGFVTAELTLPPAKTSGRKATLTGVSLHLDFSRNSVREKQIRRLVQHLKNVKGPLIIMGDFNCQWPKRDGPLKTLTHELNLHAYRPESKNLKTYPVFKTRLDWTLISRELRFPQYEVLPERLSDHFATRATILFDPDAID